ncbi:biotin/lipoyl-containing protein [Spiroplasma endosymbiont of Atherix ibis]|uniref:biotin/lipoyl-containing protein n=1 Tax=Spiroplasma endosymbiont of Atherix ibis TaxID=3066291 RepID=UPI0030D6158B
MEKIKFKNPKKYKGIVENVFVKEGQPVKKNQVLAIISTQLEKFEILSTIDGVIRNIYVIESLIVSHGDTVFDIFSNKEIKVLLKKPSNINDTLREGLNEFGYLEKLINGSDNDEENEITFENDDLSKMQNFSQNLEQETNLDISMKENYEIDFKENEKAPGLLTQEISNLSYSIIDEWNKEENHENDIVTENNQDALVNSNLNSEELQKDEESNLVEEKEIALRAIQENEEIQQTRLDNQENKKEELKNLINVDFNQIDKVIKSNEKFENKFNVIEENEKEFKNKFKDIDVKINNFNSKLYQKIKDSNREIENDINKFNNKFEELNTRINKFISESKENSSKTITSLLTKVNQKINNLDEKVKEISLLSLKNSRNDEKVNEKTVLLSKKNIATFSFKLDITALVSLQTLMVEPLKESGVDLELNAFYIKALKKTLNKYNELDSKDSLIRLIKVENNSIKDTVVEVEIDSNILDISKDIAQNNKMNNHNIKVSIFDLSNLGIDNANFGLSNNSLISIYISSLSNYFKEDGNLSSFVKISFAFNQNVLEIEDAIMFGKEFVSILRNPGFLI